jgi:hypothetical protein
VFRLHRRQKGAKRKTRAKTYWQKLARARPRRKDCQLMNFFVLLPSLVKREHLLSL